MSRRWENVIIQQEGSIRDALEKINSEALRLALVVNEDGKLIGTVSDGDIRRGLLKGCALEDSIGQVMNTSFVTADAGTPRSELIETMKKRDILSIPLLDNGVIVGMETLQHALETPKLANPVFLMAGGLGTRLRPLTESCPKPMLRVGDKPILEVVLDSFINAGFSNFYISTHYMEEKIRGYFGDGSAWKISINYIHEEEPLGTGGSLGLLPGDLPDLPVIVMNGDILTKVDYQRLLDFHQEHNAAATMCVRDYHYQVPFGVIDGENGKITSIVEKPSYQCFVNAGIYVINREIISSIPEHHHIDMPTLLEEKIKDKHEVLMFPVHEYWLDIGRIDDFEKAQAEFHALGIN